MKLNHKNVKVFPLNSETTQVCLLSPFLFNIALENQAKEIRQEKRNKMFQIGREDIKLSAEGIIPYIENPEDSIQKL